MLGKDADYFLELQTQTGWGRTLIGFATWCAPKPGWRILDVGCGPGLLPAIFAQLGYQAFGIDVDMAMFQPSAHPFIAVANIFALPFSLHTFDLITASNLLFLLPDPIHALRSLVPFLVHEGRVAMLNPSETLNDRAALRFADENGLQGLARDTLLNWARRAVENYHWSEDETNAIYHEAGMKCMASILKVGPGFGRFSWGMVESGE
jgi:SAM-dependent methyltransferase